MQRPPLCEVATALEKLSQEEMDKLVAGRLMGDKQKLLPSLERDEDPSDILKDSFFWLKDHGKDLATLKIAATNFINTVLHWSNSEIRDHSEAVFEIMWLCAWLKIQETIHIIGCLGMRDQNLNLKTPSGEQLSNMALRNIVGMTAPSDFFYIVPRDNL